MVEIGGVLESLQELLELRRRCESGDIVYAGDSADEIAVGDIGKGRQMGLVTALVGNMAARSDEPSNLFIFGVRRIA